jgi:hypothetical protein
MLHSLEHADAAVAASKFVRGRVYRTVGGGRADPWPPIAR